MMKIKQILLFAFVIVASSLFSSDLLRESLNPFSEKNIVTDIKNIAVLPVKTSKKSDHDYSIYLTEKIISAFVDSKIFSVVEREKIQSILKEGELNMSGATEIENIQKVGKLLSVDGLIVSTLVRKNNSEILILRLVKADNGQILKSVEIKLNSINENNPQNTSEFYDSKGKKQTFAINTKYYTINENNDIKYALKNFRPITRGRILYFIGQVENRGKTPIKKPDISIVLYDKSGKQLDVMRCFGERRVDSGEIIPVRGIMTGFSKKWTDYKIIYEPEEDLYCYEYINFKVSSLNFKKTSFSYSLTGQIENLNDENVRYVKIIASLYDRAGNFIGHGYGFSSIKKLKPNGVSPFKISIYDSSLAGKPYRYRLNFSSLADN